MMAAVVILSNVLVQFYLGAFLTYGAFTYPIAFLINDVVNKLEGPKRARQVILWGFVVGVFLLLNWFSDSRRVRSFGYFKNCYRVWTCFLNSTSK